MFTFWASKTFCVSLLIWQRNAYTYTIDFLLILDIIFILDHLSSYQASDLFQSLDRYNQRTQDRSKRQSLKVVETVMNEQLEGAICVIITI